MLRQGGATGAAVEELQAAVMSYKEKLKDAVAKGQAMEEERNELQRRLAEHEESARRQEVLTLSLPATPCAPRDAVSMAISAEMHQGAHLSWSWRQRLPTTRRSSRLQ